MHDEVLVYAAVMATTWWTVRGIDFDGHSGRASLPGLDKLVNASVEVTYPDDHACVDELGSASGNHVHVRGTLPV